ncbi:hypothetical protein [Bacillus sp. 03113]|uniref:hypothetical protein n=1 Tax=Bacillus sp. 03113 TaxID=2578211 RepID=UPI0011438B00|nr:hypothetical protein [Bacillus sp. 03113]
MGKSKAKKQREKQIREGLLDVTIRRGDWGNINPISRQTKTKKASILSYEKKHKKNHSQGYVEDGSFYFLLFLYIAAI